MQRPLGMPTLLHAEHSVSLRRHCRRSDSTRSRRCQRQCRPSWRWVECRVCWAGTSCQKDGSCTSHRSATLCSWPGIADEHLLENCSPLCLATVLGDLSTPNLVEHQSIRCRYRHTIAKHLIKLLQKADSNVHMRCIVCTLCLVYGDPWRKNKF